MTGNSNTIAGSLVKPVAELGQLEGLRAGGNRASTMAASPGEAFDGALTPTLTRYPNPLP